MESSEQLVFAYQHNSFDVGNSGKVDEHSHHKIVGFNRFGYTVVHYLHRFVAQILGILVGISVVSTAPTMVVMPCDVA